MKLPVALGCKRRFNEAISATLLSSPQPKICSSELSWLSCRSSWCWCSHSAMRWSCCKFCSDCFCKIPRNSCMNSCGHGNSTSCRLGSDGKTSVLTLFGAPRQGSRPSCFAHNASRPLSSEMCKWPAIGFLMVFFETSSFHVVLSSPVDCSQHCSSSCCCCLANSTYLKLTWLASVGGVWVVGFNNIANLRFISACRSYKGMSLASAPNGCSISAAIRSALSMHIMLRKQVKPHTQGCSSIPLTMMGVIAM
mmetsp:Transcript_36166/g.91014  ORF Transcript_36166/g.91014 Transcript_36166/m.91014 type:complete len:251 (+) Transcript_36166:174-926(+)